MQLLAVVSFRRFQRIDFLNLFGFILFDVRRRRATTDDPLAGGIRVHHAVFARGCLQYFPTTLTVVDDRMARTSVESTSFLRHKRTLDALLNRFTNHWYHPLAVFFDQKKARAAGLTQAIDNISFTADKYLSRALRNK